MRNNRKGVHPSTPYEQKYMIDYISATIQCKYKPNLGNCEYHSSNVYGFEVYYLQGCSRMKVCWNEKTHLLNVAGSLPYFLNGHNFSSSAMDTENSIEWIDRLLGRVGLWGASLDEVECGYIMPVGAIKPKDFIRSHHARKGSGFKLKEDEKDAGRLRKWADAFEVLKMYDAKANLVKKVDLKKRDLIARAGYNPELEYLKIEVHINKPHILSGGRDFLLEYIVNPRWLDVLNTHLINDYQRLEPMRTLELPTDKKGLSSADILLYSLADVVMNVEGEPLSEAKNQVYRRINSIPDTLLDRASKDARKRQISALFAKLRESSTSQWDLTDKLNEAISTEVGSNQDAIRKSIEDVAV